MATNPDKSFLQIQFFDGAIMFTSKLFYPLLVSGLLACSGVAHATVQDFGNLMAVSSGYSVMSSSSRDDALAESMCFNSIPDPASQPGYPFNDDAGVVLSGNYGNYSHSIPFSRKFALNNQPRYFYDDGTRHKPITSPVPEPETYAMILAGLALIGYTARRRKEEA